MAILPPEPYLSELDKHVITLLSKLILESMNCDRPMSNAPEEEVLLNDKDSLELLTLLQRLVESMEYQEGIYFVDKLLTTDSSTSKALQETNLAIRSRRHRRRPMGGYKWTGFLQRFGRVATSDSTPKRMTFRQFMIREKILFEEIGLHPQVIELLMAIFNKQKNDVERWRDNRDEADNVRIGKVISSLKNMLSNENQFQIPRIKAASALGLIVNLSVLFTTRDWDVVGGLSAIAAYSADLKKN